MINSILRKITAKISLRKTALNPLFEGQHIGGILGGTF
jgi:hypothetical protein